MVLKCSSASAQCTASFTFKEPDLRSGLLQETKGSLQSLKSRRPLMLEDFRIVVRLFRGKGHGEEQA